ncbi:MAG: hypothetical protein WBP94_16630 [Rhodomicrobiaceae bacterium]
MEQNETLGGNAQPSTRWQKRLRMGAAAASAALVLAAGTAASVQPAQADWHHHNRGPYIVGGILGGLALGTLLTAPRYYDDYGYDGRYVDYDAPPPRAYCSNYRHVDWHHHVWFDAYGRAHPCL